MGYLHIDNLYKNTTILAFRECCALEKVHGTSAHVSWKEGALGFFSGGCAYNTFVASFDQDTLSEKFIALGHSKVIVFGEAYGGKMQGMSATYGKELRFLAFDVQIGETWLSVENAADVCDKLELEFVPWVRISTDLACIDAERDRPSIVAERRGMGTDKLREGVVLRPLQEFFTSNGQRVICKHKRAEFGETKTSREIGENPARVGAEKAALEWVTDMRLAHVLDALGNPKDMSETSRVMVAMVEDIMRESAGEVEDTKETHRAIGRATLVLWKKHVMQIG